MVKVPKAKIYECQKTHCKKQWLQRVLAVYDHSGKKIIRVEASPLPKNCTNCKSPTWDRPNH